MLGQDIALLLKLSLQSIGRPLSKDIAIEIFVSPSEISKSLHRCKSAGLLYWSDLEKRVNRTALLEFLVHGLKYVFPAELGPLTRGIPTLAAAPPLKSYFAADPEPPPVWPYAEGTVRGYTFVPLYKHAAQAALRDRKLYELLALCDAVRGGRARERALAIEHLTSRLSHV